MESRKKSSKQDIKSFSLNKSEQEGYLQTVRKIYRGKSHSQISQRKSHFISVSIEYVDGFDDAFFERIKELTKK